MWNVAGRYRRSSTRVEADGARRGANKWQQRTEIAVSFMKKIGINYPNLLRCYVIRLVVFTSFLFARCTCWLYSSVFLPCVVLLPIFSLLVNIFCTAQRKSEQLTGVLLACARYTVQPYHCCAYRHMLLITLTSRSFAKHYCFFLSRSRLSISTMAFIQLRLYSLQHWEIMMSISYMR